MLKLIETELLKLRRRKLLLIMLLAALIMPFFAMLLFLLQRRNRNKPIRVLSVVCIWLYAFYYSTSRVGDILCNAYL